MQIAGAHFFISKATYLADDLLLPNGSHTSHRRFGSMEMFPSGGGLGGGEPVCNYLLPLVGLRFLQQPGILYFTFNLRANYIGKDSPPPTPPPEGDSFRFSPWRKTGSSLVVLKPAVLILLLFLFGTQGFAATDSLTATKAKETTYDVATEQQRIDLFDGTEDRKVDLGDSVISGYAERVYFKLVDSIQRLIDKHGEFDEARKAELRDYLAAQLHKVNAGNIYSVKRFDNQFRFMLGELNAVLKNRLCAYLKTNIIQSFNTFSLIKNEGCADTFLIYAAQSRPDLVFLNYKQYQDKDYALHVLEETSKIAPVTVKRYFNPNDPIYKALKTSNDTVVKIILEIKDKYTRKSNAYTLIDDIVNGNLTMQQADAIGSDPVKFLQTMLRIRARKNPLGSHSLESDLEIYSLKFVRVLNDLHMESDKVRFASIEKFTAEELYTMMVYSEEEIFTSTFNGLFNRMMVKMGPVSGFEFLKGVGDNRFRTFIKMCAGFGKLGMFLQSMTAVYQQMLMIKFAGDLGDYNDLSQAVEVADAFGSITDSLVLKILRGTIKLEYIKQKGEGNAHGAAIYGLLSNLFVDRKVGSADWFGSVSKQYAVTSFDKISNDKLFGRDTVDRWLIYFYNDEDGEESFRTFLKSFTDKNWSIADSSTYVIIQSKEGKNVQIYANKWKDEYEGQAALERIFADNNYEPNVMVHRGHSYYAFKTIEKVRDNTQIFVLGSCGGYHNLSTIIERSPEVSIISSKQIGARAVNNPMLKLMAEYIRQGKDIDWQLLWNDLSIAINKKENPKAYERYLDYIPPHKNLGAIFIKTYNKMMEL